MKSSRKDDIGCNLAEEKECWILYSLQQLSPSKFVKVAKKILDGRYSLISPDRSALRDERFQIR
ncbi:MAG: hypothetical protein V3W18_07595 [candidate division Zixibacteria bacterium]